MPDVSSWSDLLQAVPAVSVAPRHPKNNNCWNALGFVVTQHGLMRGLKATDDGEWLREQLNDPNLRPVSGLRKGWAFISGVQLSIGDVIVGARCAGTVRVSDECLVGMFDKGLVAGRFEAQEGLSLSERQDKFLVWRWPLATLDMVRYTRGKRLRTWWDFKFELVRCADVKEVSKLEADGIGVGGELRTEVGGKGGLDFGRWLAQTTARARGYTVRHSCEVLESGKFEEHTWRLAESCDPS